MPEPEEIDACKDEPLPHAVASRLARATELLGPGAKGKKIGRAAKQLRRAAKHSARATKHGDLSPGCGAALGSALESARDCVVCSAR